MPEREVSKEQSRAIRNWIENIRSGQRLMYGVWNVDGEPIVISDNDMSFARYRGSIVGVGSIVPKNILICSETHAKELEEAGIVSFQEVQKTAK